MCRTYFDYADRRKELDPAFDNCPTECVKSNKIFDLTRSAFCAECPQKQLKTDFKSAADELLYLMLARDAKSFRFERLLNTLYNTMNLEEMSPKRLTVKTHRLVNTFLREKNRCERIRELEKSKQASS